jgi:hypothetical protein
MYPDESRQQAIAEVIARPVPDAYDAKAHLLRQQYGNTPSHATLASLARESVREAMVDLAAQMCPECNRGHMPKPAGCGTWYEHKHSDYETGCSASHVWNWLNSK